MPDISSSIRHRRWWAAALGGGLLVTTVAFSPTVRAVGQSFLEAFRLPRVTAIGLDDQQISALRERLKRIESKFDLASLVGENATVQEPAARAIKVAAPTDAERFVGTAVRVPAWLPEGVTAKEIHATADGGGIQFKVNVAFANQVLDFLELHDAALPTTLDGQTIAVKLGGRVETTFARGEQRHFSLIQARLPEVTLPEGVSLTPFGYAYLRMLGLDAATAHQIAATTDWRSTLVVPIPTEATELRQIIVRGQPGFLFTSRPDTVDADDERPRRGRRWRQAGMTTLMWTEGNQVFILSGRLTESDALAIAGAAQ